MTAREVCAGVPIAAASLDEAVRMTLEPVTGDVGRAVHFCNAYTLSLAHSDAQYRELLRHAWLCFPDGQSVVWVRRLLDPRSGLEKVSGPDFFLSAFQASDASGPRHFLLGGSRDTLETLVKTLSARFPSAQIVGYFSPPFRALSEQELKAQDDAIRASEAEVVWVGLGTPKQDYEAGRLADRLPVTAVAVGAAFDFTAGTKKRAPRWMRSSGTEWVHRLLSEPRRLWRRYLVGNVVFLVAAWTDRHSR